MAARADLCRGDSNEHGLYVITFLRLFRIRAAGKDGECTVNLLSEHDASEFVRESHGTERKLLVSALAQRIRETVGVAAEKNDFAGAPVAEFAEPFGERVRIEISSASVERTTVAARSASSFLTAAAPSRTSVISTGTIGQCALRNRQG